MHADQHLFAEFLNNTLKSPKNLHQTLFGIDVFGAVKRDQKIFKRLDLIFLQRVARFDLSAERI